MTTKIRFKDKYDIDQHHIEIILLLFMAFHCLSYPVLGINTIVSALIHLTPLLLFLVHIIFKPNAINILWMILIVYIIIGNKDITNGNYIGFFSIILSFITILMLQYKKKWLKTARSALVFFSLEHIVLGWLFLILKPLYVSYIIPRFTAENRSHLIKQVNAGTFMGLANHYSTSGIYCSIAFIVFLVFTLQNPKSKKNIALLIISFISLIFTQKRGPLAFAVLTGIIVYFIYKKVRIKTILKFCAILVFLGLVLVFFYSQSSILQQALSRFMGMSEDSDISNGRMPLYNLAINIFLHNPVFGIGWAGYRYEYSNYKFLGGSATTMNAHNIYLQILSELGIVGFILLYGLMMYTLVITVKIVYKSKEYFLTEIERWMILFSLSMQILFLLSGIVENVLYYEQTMFPYALAAACSYHINYKIKKNPYIKLKKSIQSAT